MLSSTQLASRIDHTLLSPDATPTQIRQVADQALQHHFASVCVHGCYVPLVSSLLRNSPVKTCAVVGFPLGSNKPTLKAIEAVSLIKDGAQEVDFVAHLPLLLDQNLPAIKSEFLEIVRAARAVSPSVIIKVILETSLLMHNVSSDLAESRLAIACQAARESGCDFVKTSTGFHSTGGATSLAVSLLKKHSQGIYVKASGGIRSLPDAQQMLTAGADRLGTSAGLAIIQALSSSSNPTPSISSTPTSY